ncbi:MAG: hypothetical protein AAFP77_28550 [Bacteroidota bacterium]
MDRAIQNSIIRFFLLWALQVFFLKQVSWGWGGETYLQIHIYPLFILLLPLRTLRSITLGAAFILGLLIDWWYESPGMHAGALVFTAFMRSIVLSILTPREGYNIKANPTKSSLGANWFIQYAGALLFLHLFFYYSLEAFTFVYFTTILLKLFFSWLASMLVLLIVVYIFNPEA